MADGAAAGKLCLVPTDSAALPDDVVLLKRMVVTAGHEIEKLKAQIARLRRLKFGRSSEKLEASLAQLELLLEDAEEERGEQFCIEDAAGHGGRPSVLSAEC